MGKDQTTVPWRGSELNQGDILMHPEVLSVGPIYWQIHTQPRILIPQSNATRRQWHQKSHSKTWMLRSPGQSWHSTSVAGNVIWRWKTKCRLSLNDWRHIYKMVKVVKRELMHVWESVGKETSIWLPLGTCRKERLMFEKGVMEKNVGESSFETQKEYTEVGIAVVHYSDNIGSCWCHSMSVCVYTCWNYIPLNPCKQMFASLHRQIVRHLVACPTPGFLGVIKCSTTIEKLKKSLIRKFFLSRERKDRQ